MKLTKKRKIRIALYIVSLIVAAVVVFFPSNEEKIDQSQLETVYVNHGTVTNSDTTFDYESIPKYSGQPYCVINNNVPFFNPEIYKGKEFEEYAELDSKGRCGVAFANLSKATMPTEERGNIGSVKPSGWQSVKYDCVDGKYLYNRCHLIGFQLAGENANEKNLVTGTRYLNVNGMLPFENMVADYIKETENHVLYKSTPIFVESELVCRGILLEAYSTEDNGDGICFNVFCYNVQPQISINYADGTSSEIE